MAIRALILLLFLVATVLRNCNGKKLWGVDVKDSEGNEMGATGLDKLMEQAQAFLPSGGEDLDLSFLDNVNLLEMAAEGLDATIATLRENEVRHELSQPGVIRAAIEQIPSFLMESFADSEELQALLALETSSPVLFRANIEEKINALMDVLVPLSADLKDKDRLKARLREYLPSLGVTGEPLEEVVAMVDDPSKLNEIVKTQVTEMLELFNQPEMGAMMEMMAAMEGDPEMAELLQQLQSDPALMEQAYLELLQNPDLLSGLDSAEDDVPKGIGGFAGLGGGRGGRAATRGL